MITWEHLRFLALLIPTWLVLGAIAVSLAVPSKGRAGHDENVIQSSVATCKDSVGVAVQQHKAGLVVAADGYREFSAAVAEE